jgi:electron transport complex protein RnfG
MSQSQNIATSTQPSSFKMLRAMVGIGLACALMIVSVYEGTLPRIERLRAEALEKAIFKVIPGTATKKTFFYDAKAGFQPYQNEEGVGQLIHAGYDEAGNLVGVAVEASGLGFADVVRVLYGYDPKEQAVIGFHVLESKETPGLGDKIEKEPHFLANFEALDVSLQEDNDQLKNKVITVKQGQKEQPWQLDGITGATITSRAVGDILGASTEQWVPIIYQHQQSLATAVNMENEE